MIRLNERLESSLSNWMEPQSAAAIRVVQGHESLRSQASLRPVNIPSHLRHHRKQTVTKLHVQTTCKELFSLYLDILFVFPVQLVFRHFRYIVTSTRLE